jgi:hypothetical protein
MKHITIKGEVNILRYLSRLGPPRYNYELSNDPATSARLDDILDTCYSLARCRTVKEQQSLIHSLNSCLGKSQFMAGGDGISVADIAVWSVLKQIDVGPLSDSMNKWLQQCCHLLRLGKGFANYLHEVEGSRCIQDVDCGLMGCDVRSIVGGLEDCTAS